MSKLSVSYTEFVHSLSTVTTVLQLKQCCVAVWHIWVIWGQVDRALRPGLRGGIARTQTLLIRRMATDVFGLPPSHCLENLQARCLLF